MTRGGTIDAYIDEVSRQFATGAATEHSYRPALQRLLSALFPKMTVVNEPSHIECGAPDFLVRENGPARRPVGYVEAKDVGDGDLDGNSRHKEQFDRYKAELSNIVFTDYLDFHFYEDGAFVAKCRIAEVQGRRIVPAAPEELERFEELMRRFGETAPKRISSPSRLAALMAGKARLLARAVAATLRGGDASSSLAQQLAAFRQWLVHDLDEASFADIYAQTIVYGMFAARLHDTTPEDFSRSEAASLVPRSNPLLRRLFRDLDEYVDDSVVWIIDDLVSLFAASDVAAIMRGYGKTDRDPLLHFYEDFLAAYNPALRKQRGVWYTPAPVVGFIVRSVDAILRRDFGLSGGLADPAKTVVAGREMHRVQILDPAAGTGTFLAEVVRHVRAKFKGQEGLWPGYAREHLVPRLNGFEILMASYAMAHLKLDMLLSESADECANVANVASANSQCPIGNNSSRLRIFLTNSLEEFSEATGTLWAMELSNEAREADFIKRDCPVMVVMGNPPYSVSSSNKGEWIRNLVADYKKGLNEKKINLDDDYIKFIRLGQHYVERNGEGILAYISNNSFLDGITHRQMRKSLMETFDEIYILDLHGNARKKEVAPDGGKDENVFDIMQGVSINIFVKQGTGNGLTQRRRETEIAEKISAAKNAKTAKVFHAEVYGEREAKYAFLEGSDVESAGYKEIHPAEPYCFFVPKDFALEEEYKKGFSIAELMLVHNSGVKTDRDTLFVDDDRSHLQMRIATLLSGDLPQSFRDQYNVKNSGSYKIAERISGRKIDYSLFCRDAFRPFDIKWIYYDPTLISRPASSVMRQFARGPRFVVAADGTKPVPPGNVGLVACRTHSAPSFRHVFATDAIADVHLVSDQSYVFPLYLYNENMGKEEKTANLDPAIVAKLEKSLCALRLSAPLRETKPAPSRALAYYRLFELGRTWYDVAPVEEIASLAPIPVTPDPTADRRKVKEIFRAMPPVKNLHDGRTVRFPVRAARKLIATHRLDIMGIAHAFPVLFKNAYRAYTENAEIPDHKEHRNITAHHQYVSKMQLEGKCYYVRFTAREDERRGKRAELHGVTITGVSVYNAEGAELSLRTHAHGEDSTPFDVRMIPFPYDTVKGDKSGPFIDYKMALFLSYRGEETKATKETEEPTPAHLAPEDVFNYVYGVLHTPQYRERYKEFLKVDFPRIPYPSSGARFRRIAAIGAKLVAVHLLKDPAVCDMFSPVASFPVAGSNRVEAIRTSDSRLRTSNSGLRAAEVSSPKSEALRVHINDTQYFDNVPAEAWELFVGGYQPAQKWLKDRKGRVLSPDDALHYKKIVAALAETRRLAEALREAAAGGEGGAEA